MHQVLYLFLVEARWVEIVKPMLLSIVHSGVNVFSLSVWKLLEEIILGSIELIITKLVTKVFIFMASAGHFFPWNIDVRLSLTTWSRLILSILFLFHLFLSLRWSASLSSSYIWSQLSISIYTISFTFSIFTIKMVIIILIRTRVIKVWESMIGIVRMAIVFTFVASSLSDWSWFFLCLMFTNIHTMIRLSHYLFLLRLFSLWSILIHFLSLWIQ